MDSEEKEPKKAEKYRLNLELPTHFEDLLKQIIKDTDAASRAEVIRCALAAYGELVKYKNKPVRVVFKNHLLLIEEDKPQQ